MLIATDAITTLKEIALRFLTRTDVPERDRWLALSDDGIWKHVVDQVVVAGNASAQTRLAKSTDLQNALTFESIRDLSPSDRRAIIHNALRTSGARYASADITKCRRPTLSRQTLISWLHSPADHTHIFNSWPLFLTTKRA
jgi:hypothetical protein